MNNTKTRENLRALVESAVLIAVGFTLSYYRIFELPQGGSVTPLSMLPILMIGLRHSFKWGVGGGVIYACLQMLQSFWPPPSGTVAAYVSVVMLDYVLAFGVLGISAIFRGKRYGLVYAAALCVSLRFLCHFISGIVIWSTYWRDPGAWLFSLTYNGSYMGVELVFTTVISVLLCKAAPVLFVGKKQPG